MTDQLTAEQINIRDTFAKHLANKFIDQFISLFIATMDNPIQAPAITAYYTQMATTLMLANGYIYDAFNLAVKTSRNPSLFKAVIEGIPDGVTKMLANARIKEFKKFILDTRRYPELFNAVIEGIPDGVTQILASTQSRYFDDIVRETKGYPALMAAVIKGTPDGIIQMLANGRSFSLSKLIPEIRTNSALMDAVIEGIPLGITRMLVNGRFNDFDYLVQATKNNRALASTITPQHIRDATTLMLAKGGVDSFVLLVAATEDTPALAAAIERTGVFFCGKEQMAHDQTGRSYNTFIHVTDKGVSLYAGCHINVSVSDNFARWAKDERDVGDNRREVYVPTIMGLLQQAIQSPHLPENLRAVASREFQARQRQWQELTGTSITPRAFG